MPKKKARAPAKSARMEPLSLSPLSPEEALSQFMKADPERVERLLEKQGVKKPKK